MRNLVKVLGIIAMIAIVGLAVSCDVAPEDQTVITISGMAESYNGKYALVAVYEDDSLAELLGVIKYLQVIKSGSAKEMALWDDKGEAVIVKQGVVVLGIYESDTKESELSYYGISKQAITLGKGGFTIDADKFYPDLTAAVDTNKPTANDYGTYTTEYTNNAGTKITETVVLTDASFNISDDTGGRTGANADQLNFKIENWEKATGDLPTGYTGGYKFTGRILSEKNYVPSSKTAPETSGFSEANKAADVKADGNGTVCWMYIYFKGDVGNITFVRSAFSRTGSTENKSIVTGSDNSNRVYTKK